MVLGYIPIMSITPEQARKQAKRIFGLYITLFWFVIVNILVYILDYRDNNRIDWAYWVTFGWGIGLASQAFSIYFGIGFVEKITEDILNKDK